MKSRSWKLFGLLAVVAVSFGPARAQAQEGAKVVVLDFDGGDTGLSDEERSGMSDRLSDVFTKSGKYDVVPRDEFKAAVASRESKTGKPCNDDKCMMQVARSLGAQGAVRPKVKRDGRGCAVSLGMLGGGGDQVLGSSVKNKCSMKSMAVAMDGAMVEMTYKMGKEKPLIEEAAAEEVEEAKRQAETTAAKAAADLSDDDVEEDLPEEDEEQEVDREAEERAKGMEAEAAKKLRW